MQKSKLQVKTPRWVDIILVFLIIVEVGYIIYLKIDFLNKNLGAIQAISTIVLVIITIFYALETRQHRKIIEKEAQRLKIVELCRDFYLLYQQLNSEIKNLRRKKYNWNGRESKWRELKNLKKLKDFLLPIKFIDISKKFPQIKEKIESHDEKVLEIEKKLKRIDEIILSKGFEDECKKLIDEFNERHSEEIEKSPGLKCRYNDIPFFLKHVVDNDKDVGKHFPYYQFWKENGIKLLKIREDKEIKKEMEELYEISDELNDVSIDLRNKILNQILDYRDGFYITDEEIIKA